MPYTVKTGDTMVKIAAGLGVTAGALIRANPQIEDPARIFTGQELNIPGEGPTGQTAFVEQYRVRSGDSMGKIARAFEVTLSDLVAANPQISNPSVIRVGEIVHVPPTDPTRSVQRITKPPGGNGPEWFRIARRELKSDVEEFAGRADNPRILEYHASVPGARAEDENPWCSSFVNWCIEQSGNQGTNDALARSWARWGKELAEPRVGAVAVFWRVSKSSKKGHVGFYVDDSPTSVSVLGGNQGERVSIASYSKDRLLGYRWAN